MHIPHRAILMFTVGVSAMFVFYWLCMRYFVQPQRERHQWTTSRLTAVSLLVLYLPGLLLLWLFIKDLPLIPLPAVRYSLGDYLLVFLAQFFSVALMALVTALEDKARGKGVPLPENKLQYQTAYDHVHLLVLVPLLEELLTRGLLGARIAGTDSMVFLLLSALIFSLIHLQTGRIAVAVGMFWNGLLWAWVYVASGSFLVSALFHGMFNLLVTCLPERLEKKRSQQAMGLYMGLLLLAGVVGAGLLWFNRARLLPTEHGSPLWLAAGAILSNPGTWVLILVCVASYFIKKYQPAREKSASEGSVD